MTEAKRHLQDVSDTSDIIPAWERPTLRSAIGGSEEAKTKKMETRVTAGRHRACQKIIQQRLLPEIETQSDLVQAGIGMVLDYARMHGKNSDDFRRAVDVATWENELHSIVSYEERVGRLLDQTEQGLKDAKDRGRKLKFLALFDSLVQNKDDIEDEGLKARAKKLWILHREHAKELRSSK